MAHVVVEINGVRHEMVKTRNGGDLCKRCSIESECKHEIDTHCIGMNSYFRKERKKKDDGKEN